MNKKQRAELRMSTNYAKTASIIMTPEQLASRYDRYLEEYQKRVERGIRLEGYSSKEEFAERWARAWATGDANIRKNPLRAIVNSDQKISSDQAAAIHEYFTEKSVQKFLDLQEKREKAARLWRAKKGNENREYKGIYAVDLTEEEKAALKKMAELGINKVKTQEFHDAYMKVKGIMKDYYSSLNDKQKRKNREGNSGSWFYEIFYV